MLVVQTLPGQKQLHIFGRPNSVADNRLGPAFLMARYLEIRDKYYG